MSNANQQLVNNRRETRAGCFRQVSFALQAGVGSPAIVLCLTCGVNSWSWIVCIWT